VSGTLPHDTDNAVHSDTLLRIGYAGAVLDPAEGTDLPPLRSDVQRNRRALLAAARELFESRRDVPLYEVARRAGVGQATLYRHFADRRALVLALVDEQIDRFEAEAAATVPAGPDGYVALVRLLVAELSRSRALVELLDDEGDTDPDDPASAVYGFTQRLLAQIRPYWEQAGAAGLVRPDLRLDDVLVVLGMVKGVVESAPPERQDELTARALDLALHGILARP